MDSPKNLPIADQIEDITATVIVIKADGSTIPGEFELVECAGAGTGEGICIGQAEPPEQAKI